jgi:multidrug efflux pump subunit AcrB
MNELKKKFSVVNGVVFLYHQPTQEKIDESFSGMPALFGVTIFGNNMNKLTKYALKIEKILNSDSAIGSVINNTKIKVPFLNIRVNNLKASEFGLTASDVSKVIKASKLGIKCFDIVREKNTIPVMIRLTNSKTTSIYDIKNLPIPTKNGKLIPLKAIADIIITRSVGKITRTNGRRGITLIAEVDGSIPSLISRLKQKFSQLKLDKGYHIEFGGQYPVLIKTLIQIVSIIAFALFLIYFILLIQFNSWKQPLIILLGVPFSFSGALIALFIAQGSLDISVGMGLLTLAGISVNNIIVLLEYANRLRLSEGLDIKNALINAAKIRLRPILMTASTTIFALLPAVFIHSIGSRIFQSFALSIIGGMVSASLLTLLVIPTIYYLVEKQ